jgi:hypothetical protein
VDANQGQVQAAEGKRPDRNAEMKSGVKICLRHMENKLKPLLALKYKAIDDVKKELGDIANPK